MEAEKPDVVIVGGGPAGLRAAELLSAAGLRTILAEHKASVGRKFLVAGRGGLNVTHSEPLEKFTARYGNDTKRWESLLADFSPDDLRAWARDLGIDTFVGTSRRVFPETKQAAPLLRRWIERLRRQGVGFRAKHQLTGFTRVNDEWEVTFATPTEVVKVRTRAVIFALGGASWPQTGSDGAWVELFLKAGVRVTPLTACNSGYEVNWLTSFLAEAEGRPLKNIAVRAGNESVAGELLFTKYGIEGGAIYQLGRVLRTMKTPAISIDLKPSYSAAQLTAKMNSKAQSNLLEQATPAWKLSPAAVALLRLRGPFTSITQLVETTKAFPLALRGPRPIEEAISTAGGVSWSELDDGLMIKSHPGLFCAGEMIDWDAPTGGYLLQGCFSTATRAARSAQRFVSTPPNLCIK